MQSGVITDFQAGLVRSFGPRTGRCRLAMMMATPVFHVSRREELSPVQGVGRPVFDRSIRCFGVFPGAMMSLSQNSILTLVRSNEKLFSTASE